MSRQQTLKKPDEAAMCHLLEAIERVRTDVEKVEFWAGAVAGFVQPVPEYDERKATIWMPLEQAHGLKKAGG